MRTCVGCGENASPAELLRFVRGPLSDGRADVAVDLVGGDARGAHVHPNAACLEKAAKHGFSKSFRCTVRMTTEELAGQIEGAYERRIAGLLMAAWRTRALEAGADAALAALKNGVSLVVVATDAGSIADEHAVTAAASEGRIVRWGDKATLAALTGRSELGIVAVKSEPIASEIRRAAERVAMVAAGLKGSSVKVDVSDRPEVR